MLVKYFTPARPSVYNLRLVRPPTYYLRTTLATRSSLFIHDRCAFQFHTTHSETPKSEAKDGLLSILTKIGITVVVCTGIVTLGLVSHTYSFDKAILDGLQKVKEKVKEKEKEKEKKKENENAVFHAIEQGSYPKSESNWVIRQAVIEELQKILSDSYSYGYHLVVGEHGTGKTTVITQAVNGIGEGIVYVQGSRDLDEFSNAFAKALGWKYKIAFKDNFNEGPRDELNRAMDAFRRSAAKYKAKYNKPAVLILDNINGLAEKHPEVIERLQEIARIVADNKEFTFVFVASEGTVPALLSGKSAWSRAYKPPFIIPDFTEDEALAYLWDTLLLKGGKEEKEKEEKEKKEIAKQLYQLFGGRIKLLQRFSMLINDGKSLEDIRKTAFVEAATILQEAKISGKDEYESIGKRVIQELVKKKKKGEMMTIHDLCDITKDSNIADMLLQTNVFSFHIKRRTVTFQSPLIEAYVMENLEEFGL